MNEKIKYFDVYTQFLNWQIIPINPETKIPVIKEWNKDYDLENIRKLIYRNPELNLGLRLGNIIDVEADTEGANKLLNQIIGDYKHPIYKSNRSYHHLFLTPDLSLTKLVFQGIEFRGRLHQSLLPPSIVNNSVYKWIQVYFPIPEMPASLKKFYWKNFNSLKMKPGFIKVDCRLCKNEVPIHKKRYKYEIDIFKNLNISWSCSKCRDDKIKEYLKK